MISIADLKSRNPALFVDKPNVYVSGYYEEDDGGGGVFYYDAEASDADDGGSIIAPTAGAGRYRRIFNDSGTVSVRMFGAVGDGVTDDTTAIQAALNSGLDVFLPAGDYLVSATLSLARIGQRLFGCGGIVDSVRSKLISSATSGPVVHVGYRSCRIQRLMVDSTSARFAASTTTGHGIRIAGPDQASFYSMSRQVMEDVYIVGQPTDGLHCIGTLEYSYFQNVTVADCKRHGFAHDAGTLSGYTNKVSTAFWVHYDRCRAIENGGWGFYITSDGGNSSVGVLLTQPEALGNTWNHTALSLTQRYQMVLVGSLFTVNCPDVEDQQYAATATSSTARERLGNATPSAGIYHGGVGITVTAGHFSSLLSTFFSDSGDGVMIFWPRIFAGAYGVNQDPAITTSVNTVGFSLWANTQLTTGAARLIQNQSQTARLFIDGIEYAGIAWSQGDWVINHHTPLESTIASGGLDVRGQRVTVLGEGGAADSVGAMRVVSGYIGENGLSAILLYGGQDITFITGGNVVPLGANAVLDATHPVAYASSDGTNWSVFIP